MQKIEIFDIPGVKLIPYSKFFDERGYFCKILDKEILLDMDLSFEYNSIALSSNDHAGTIRGLHFQSEPFAEEKIIACLYGRIFDVAVDLRSGSPTFRKWGSITLSSDEPRIIFLPKGVAHGFQTLEKNSVLLYELSAPYNQESAHTLSYADSDLNIKWPLTISNISKKDVAGISLGSAIDLSNRV